MFNQSNPALSRRSFLAASVAGVTATAFGKPTFADSRNRGFSLRAAPGAARLVPNPHPETLAWCYNGNVPGPELRVRRGDRLRIEITNGLAEESTAAPRERVEIAFVADNPADWMFHCHILEHQAAGMMGLIRVA